MIIAVLGSGRVGQTIGSKLIEIGFEVILGSRSSDNENAKRWVEENGENATNGTFDYAAAFARDFIFNCTAGAHSLEALNLINKNLLRDKILIDIANPLDFSAGQPPSLHYAPDVSLAERIQQDYPDLHVIKAFNSMNHDVMVNPNRIQNGDHDFFIAGNDSDAKAKLRRDILEPFGWKRIIDLGDISAARGMEMLLPIWLKLWTEIGHTNFNFKIVKGE